MRLRRLLCETRTWPRACQARHRGLPVAVFVGGGFLLLALVAAFALTGNEPSRPF